MESRGARFVQQNLELLGFGTHANALVQAVKELFENALDAIWSSEPSDITEEMGQDEMLRISVRDVLLPDEQATRVVEIVCSDTGGGIQTHRIQQLCCGIFETTKACTTTSDPTTAVTSGKFGIGLKGAMLYSQQHSHEQSCLKLSTTSANTSDILHAHLQIGCTTDQNAIVQHVQSFQMDESHVDFSGTEMRLQLPLPDTNEELEDVADTLAIYFQTFRYSCPSYLAIDFHFHVREIQLDLQIQSGEEPEHRLLDDFRVDLDDVVYVQEESSDLAVSISCIALLQGSTIMTEATDFDICLLRYANHVPLINNDDIWIGGMAKGLLNKKVWRKHGYICRPNSTSPLLNQFKANPRGSRNKKDQTSPFTLVLAIDISSNVCEDRTGGLRYGCLKKSILDDCYSHLVSSCCAQLVQKLVDQSVLASPFIERDKSIIDTYAPFIANIVANISNTSTSVGGMWDASSVDRPYIDQEDVTTRLQQLLRQQLHFK